MSLGTGMLCDPHTGELVQTIDGGPFPDAIRAEVPEPPGLNAAYLASTRVATAFNRRACDVCHVSESDSGEIVVCSGCEAPLWHIDCMPEAVKEIISEDFFCPSCSCEHCRLNAYPINVMRVCGTCRKPMGHYGCAPPACTTCSQ